MCNLCIREFVWREGFCPKDHNFDASKNVWIKKYITRCDDFSHFIRLNACKPAKRRLQIATSSWRRKLLMGFMSWDGSSIKAPDYISLSQCKDWKCPNEMGSGIVIPMTTSCKLKILEDVAILLALWLRWLCAVFVGYSMKKFLFLCLCCNWVDMTNLWRMHKHIARRAVAWLVACSTLTSW